MIAPRYLIRGFVLCMLAAVVTAPNAAAHDLVAVRADRPSFHGRVTARRTGEPLVGASVTVALADTTLSAETDSRGSFTIADVPPGEHTVIVRAVGYRAFTRRVVVGQDSVAVSFALENEALRLEALVASAAGPQRRRDVGYAITTLRMDSLREHTPFVTLSELLAHRVPGLTVQATSGAPGDPARLRLRGLGSVLRNQDPVVIVDGVRIYAVQAEARSGNLTNLDPAAAVSPNRRIYPIDMAAPSPLDQIDLNAIETVEVFQGPSAATLYGAGAANGVIVITTKRGQRGRTQWHASLTRGRTTMPAEFSTGYYRWGHDVGTGIPQLCPPFATSCVQDSMVPFQALNDAALRPFDRGRRTSFSLTASGGTPALTYSITGTYRDEIGPLRLPAIESERFRTMFNRDPEDWMQRPHRLESWSVASAVGATLGRTASLTLSTRLARTEQQRSSLENQLVALMGTYADTANGLYYRPSPMADYTIAAAASLVPNYYIQQSASMVTSTSALGLEWRPRPWLSARGQAGLDLVARNDVLLQPAGYVSATDSGARVRGTGRSLVGSINLSGEVRRPLGAGYTFATNVGTNLVASRTDDQVGSAIQLRPGMTGMDGAQLLYGTDFAGQASVYGWWIEPRLVGPRLALSAALRLDGGSTYGSGNSDGMGRVTGLPKLNGSWVMSEESWFPRALRTVVSSLRWRGAYGQVQLHPGPADHLRLYADSMTAVASQLVLANVGNTRLRPERATEIEGGLDADLLDDAVSVALTAYRKTHTDALLPVQLPPSLQAGATVLHNAGTVRNTGLELAVGVTPLRSSALTWSTQLLYSRNRNVLVELGAGVVPDTAAGLVEGHALYSRWAHPITGFSDQNGDGVLQPAEVEVGSGFVYRGQLQPKYAMALATDVTLFGGAVGLAAGASYEDGATQVDRTAQTNWMLQQALADPSMPLQAQAAAVAATRKTNPSEYSTMHRLATLRFTSLSMSYRVPASLARLVGAHQLSVVVQGSNLGVRSTYTGRDPNVSAWTTSGWLVDSGQLPPPRLWQLAVRLTY